MAARKQKNDEKNQQTQAVETISIGYVQSGSYDDDDNYDLVIDESAKSAMIVHSFHHWRPNGTKEGTENLTLDELKRDYPAGYRKAIEILKSKGFPPDSLTK